MSKYRVLTLGFMHGFNGISTSAMNLYRALDRDLFQWDFVFRKEEKINRDSKHPGNFTQEIERLGGRIHYLGYNYGNIPKHSRKKFQEILMSDKNIMGVHVHDLGTNTYPLWAADQLGKPIKVIQFHSACAKSKVQEALDTTPRAKKVRLKMISGEQYDRLACSDLAGITAYYGYDFQIFPNAVDTEKFSYREAYRQIIREQLGIDKDALTIGFVGTLYEVKRPLFACETFKEVFAARPDAHLIVLGGGPDLNDCMKYVNEFEDMVPHVHFLGGQKSVDMFYSAMDVLLMPSRLEGFPNVCVEAQSAGVSCLLSDEITELACLTPLAKQFDFNADAHAWAAEVIKMAQAAPKRRSWAKEIKAAGYDIHDAARKLEELYLRRIEEAKRAAV